MLDFYPRNNGHLMIVPTRHVSTLALPSPKEVSDLMCVMRYVEMALAEAYTPQSINVGINLGAAAGPVVVGRLHVHLVPSWTSDTSSTSSVTSSSVSPDTTNKRRARKVGWLCGFCGFPS